MHITPKKWNYCTDAEHHKDLFVFPMTKESLSLRHLAITFFIWKLILEMSFHWLVRRMNCPNPASSCPSLGERALDLSWSVRRGCSFVTVPILGCLPKDHPEHSSVELTLPRWSYRASWPHIRRSSQREVGKHLMWGQLIEQCLKTP